MSEFSQPQRQSAMGFVIYIGRNIRTIISLLLSFFAFGALQSIAFIFIGLLVILGVIVVLIFSYLQYEFFTFQIENDELIVNEGVVFRERKVIPFHRIQTVHLHQNLLQRITQLVGVKVDTAGSKGKELEIPALRRKKAEALRDLLREKSTQTITDEKIALEGQASTADDQNQEQQQLVKLHLGNLFVLGITENHLRSGFLAMAFVFGYFQQYADFVQKYIQPKVEAFLPEGSEVNIPLILGAIIVFLMGSILISMIRVILKFYGFEARLIENFIQIQSGLLRRNQYRIPSKKVQFIELHTNFIRRRLGFATAKIYQAQSASSDTNQSLEIPACYAHHQQAIKQHLYSGIIEAPTINVKADAIAYLRFGALMGLLPMPFLIWAAIDLSFYLYIPVAIFYLYVLYSSWRYGKTVTVSINEEMLIISRGWLFPSTIIIPMYKAQSLAISQNIFLKRRKLAHFIIHTASGRRSVRFLPEAIVYELINYQLAKVELYRGELM